MISSNKINITYGVIIIFVILSLLFLYNKKEPLTENFEILTENQEVGDYSVLIGSTDNVVFGTKTTQESLTQLFDNKLQLNNDNKLIVPNVSSTDVLTLESTSNIKINAATAINATGVINASGPINSRGVINASAVINATGGINASAVINATGGINASAVINATGGINATGNINTTNGALTSTINSAEGGCLYLYNHNKDNSTAKCPLWGIYNMTGDYGNGLHFYTYLNGNPTGSSLILYDNKTSKFSGGLTVESGGLNVQGQTNLYADTVVYGDLWLANNKHIRTQAGGQIVSASTLTVLSGGANITGAVNINGGATITGATYIKGTGELGNSFHFHNPDKTTIATQAATWTIYNMNNYGGANGLAFWKYGISGCAAGNKCNQHLILNDDGTSDFNGNIIARGGINAVNQLIQTSHIVDAGGVQAGWMHSWAFTNYSDIRLKENIKNISQNEKDKVLQLVPKTYNLIKDKKKIKKYGLIAQEVEELYPELVTTNDTDGMKLINYIELIPLLLEQIKELKKTIPNPNVLNIGGVTLTSNELLKLKQLINQ
jgi:hypothetical protein